MTGKDFSERMQLKNVALFNSEDDETATPTVLPIDSIVLPLSQPRRYFSPSSMDSLVESVRQDGILQPLLVRPLNAGVYQLVAGERRLRAARECGLSSVPVFVRELDDRQSLAYALKENLQREDLNPIEETEGILQLLSLRLDKTVAKVQSLLYRFQKELQGKITAHNVIGSPDAEVIEDVFKSIGRMNLGSFLTNRLPLLKMPEDIQKVLKEGSLEYTKAAYIAKLPEVELRAQVLEEAISKDLSLNEIKEMVRTFQPSSSRQLSDLKSWWESTYKLGKKSKAWEEPKKRKKLESLLKQLEELLGIE